jgi:hypothetical protein
MVDQWTGHACFRGFAVFQQRKTKGPPVELVTMFEMLWLGVDRLLVVTS